MDFIQVEIVNWEKYNPRKDIKKPWWFALSNTITSDDIFSEFSDAEFRAWIHILCTASVQMTNRPRLFLKAADSKAKIRKSVLLSTLQKLETLEIIKNPYESRTQSERNPNSTRQDKTEQDNTKQNTVCTVLQSKPAPTQVKSDQDLVFILSEKTKTLYAESPEYIPREALKAWAWCENNSRKAPKSLRGWRQFFSGWLERGWDRHRKTLSTSADSGINWKKYEEKTNAG